MRSSQRVLAMVMDAGQGVRPRLEHVYPDASFGAAHHLYPRRHPHLTPDARRAERRHRELPAHDQGTGCTLAGEAESPAGYHSVAVKARISASDVTIVRL